MNDCFNNEYNLNIESYQNFSYLSLYSEDNNDNEYDIKNNNIFSITCKFNRVNHLIQEEKTTAFKTNNQYYYYNILEQPMDNEEKEGIPPFFSLDKIIEIFDKEIMDSNIKKQIIEGKTFVENSLGYNYMEYTKKKRKRNEDTFKNFYVIVDKKDKRGRKTNNNHRNIHDKNKPDNIIKKIKAILFKSSLTFVNNILNMNEQKKLLKLDYDKYVNTLKREEELNLLKMSLKEFFSREISKKYNTKEKKPDHNKIIIDNLINDIMAQKEENIKDNINYKTIMFIFNITFEDFIDIYTYKKSLDDLLNDYKINKNEIDYMRIKNNIRGINDISKDITKKNEGKYFSLFIFYLYNYKRWFYLRKCRNLPLDEKK